MSKETPFHQRLKQRDRDIYRVIMAQCRKQVVIHLMKNWNISWNEGEDLFQKGLLLLLDKLDKDAFPSSFEAVEQVCSWLRTVGVNDLRNKYKKKKEEPMPEVIKEKPEEEGWMEMVKRITWEELNQLGEPCQSILMDKYYDVAKYSWEELAVKYSSTATAIRQKARQCRKMLERNVQNHPDFTGYQ